MSHLHKLIKYGIFDEAYLLKSVDSKIYQTMKNLYIMYRMLLTRTPVSNTDDNLLGIAGLLKANGKSTALGVPLNSNPWVYKIDDEKTILQVT